MRKLVVAVICLFVLTLCSIAFADVAINEINFPDEGFRSQIQNLDQDRNGILDDNELQKVKMARCTESVKGIELLPNLQRLDCAYSDLKSIDISQCKALQILDVQGCKDINIVFNEGLTELNCDHCNLSWLDVSALPALKVLICSWNQLEKIDISQNTILETLDCSGNRITNIDVSKNLNLKELRCSNQDHPTKDINLYLEKLDVSRNLKLEVLDCHGNMYMKNLDVSNNPELRELSCTWLQITSLDLSNNPKLERLMTHETMIETLDVRNCPVLCQYMFDYPREEHEHGTKFGEDFDMNYETIVIGDYTSYSIDTTPPPTQNPAPDPTPAPPTPPVTPSPTATNTKTPDPTPTPTPESQMDIPLPGITAEGIKYEFDNVKKTATVIGYENKELKEIKIPNTITVLKWTYKVTAIAKNAFKGLKKAVKVTIGKNVTKIGKNAFYDCKKLKTIIFEGTKIKQIDKNAFKNIYSKATFKCPGKKLKAYTRLIRNAGATKNAKYTK